MNWQPIETAPKDDTPVDLWCAEYNERLTNYVRVDCGDGNVWYDPVEDGRMVVREATHWMPVPEPPEDPRYELTDAGREALGGGE